MVLQAILYKRGSLQILDQLELPHRDTYQKISNVEDAWHAIKTMQVRGAPAIAIVAALALAVELNNDTKTHDENVEDDAKSAEANIIKKLDYLVTSRPTAVNLGDAAKKLEDKVRCVGERAGSTRSTIECTYIVAAEKMLTDDVRDNENIGIYGAQWIMDRSETTGARQKVSVLTHCNTGSLATAGYGTALGVVRSLHSRNALKQVYYTETRPYNQGSRLTGYELIHDGIPATLITDSMAAALLHLKREAESIAAVIVGADRVSACGDTANKIGTYALAILARHHNVKFLVAAPRTTIDLNTTSGKEIIIEERSPEEMTVIKGPLVRHSKGGDANIDCESVVKVSIAANGSHAWNPAFDVTPAELIDGIVTEVGVVEKGKDGQFNFDSIFEERKANGNLNS